MTTEMVYGSLREKIAAESARKAEEHQRWQILVRDAEDAGRAAGTFCLPPTMVVVGKDRNGHQQEWRVPEGPCGFAWVKFIPEAGGESRRFVNWATGKVKTKYPCHFKADKAYSGGFDYWIHDYNQSVTRKERHADAFAAALAGKIPGLKVYGGSRLD